MTDWPARPGPEKRSEEVPSGKGDAQLQAQQRWQEGELSTTTNEFAPVRNGIGRRTQDASYKSTSELRPNKKKVWGKLRLAQAESL
jgi:hypothetical protein